MNLYVYDTVTKETKKLTQFTEFDVKFPSLGNTAIVFENGGYLYTLDLATEAVKRIPVVIKEDFDSGRGGLRDVGKEVTNFEIAPDGSRALLGARGDIFTVPEKNGPTRNLTGTPGVHERNSKWSPDGKWIAYVSDATGEDEVYMLAQDGSGQAFQLTKGGDTYKYQIFWSPDSKKILWADKKQRLQYVDVDTKRVVLVAESKDWEFSDYAWSPDSRWIAFARPEAKRMTTIQLYSVDKGTTHEVTDGWFSSGEPVFSADGKYLFFVSARTFTPTYGQTEFNHIYTDMSQIYLVTLAADTPSPFAPKSDEVKIKDDKKEPAKKDEADKKKKEAGVVVKVDPEGIGTRIAVLPVKASNYRNLQSVGDKLFYVRAGRRDERPALLVYSFEKEKETELGTIGGYEISADGKKMIVGADGGYAIIDLPSAKIDLKERPNLGDMKVKLDRRAEWNQIFAECWRQMRDFMFSPTLHGVDWAGIRKTYEQLLPYVNHRTDLTYIIGEMIGELNIGHAYREDPEGSELGPCAALSAH